VAETIRGINVVIGADTTGLSKALSDVNKKSRDIQSELRQVERLLKLDPSNTELLAQKQKLLGDAVQNTREKLDRLRAVQEQVNEQFTRGEISEGQYRAFQREVAKTEQELKKLETQLKGMEPAVKSLGERMQEAGEKMKNAGEKMTDAGKKLSVGVTAPIAAIGTVATKAAVDFESAFAGVRKTVDATEEEFAQIEQGIREMSKRMPAAATDIAAVAEAAGQLGIETDNILKFTETMIGLGEATNLTAEEGATQFARFANIVGMSQQDFDRLGSSVVALGNSLATTEAEIVAMGMRLAGQGAQIGMTEAQIMALAAAMSSVGIEAEAGGTAMSTTLKKMQTAVSLAGEDLDKFASVARMSASDFAKAFSADPAAALQAFVDGLAASSAAGENLTLILNDLGISGIRESDTLLRLAGASDVLRSAIETSTEAWEDNTALQNEVAQRYATTESKLGMFKNQLADVAITLGQALIPALMDMLKAAQPLIDTIANAARWFAGLDENTQKTIITITGLVAAIGPLLIILGKLTSTVGSIVSIFGRMSVVSAAAAASTAAAGTAAGGAAAGFATLLGPITLAVAGIAALTAGGIALYKHLSQESIPEIQRFGDEVSESTQQAVGAFMDLNDQATVALNDLAWSGRTVTQEMADSIVSAFAGMGDQILASMEERHAEEIASMQEFFASAKGLTEEEQAEILANVQQSQENQRLAVEEGQARIEEILRLASEQKRGLTQEEAAEINRIQQQMLQTGIEMLSENEVEQKLILERMRENANDLTARQAAEVVKNSVKQKDESIKAAEEQYDDVLRSIIRMRDETGEIAAEQADKLIAEAQRQRDESIKRAEEMHQRVVDEAKKQANEHVNSVNWETGEVLNRWQKLGNDIKDVWNNIVNWIKDAWDNIKRWVSNGVNAVGDAVRDGMNRAKQRIEDIWNRVVGFFKNLNLGQIGKDMMQGLVDGIGSMANTVWEKAKSIAQGIGDSIKQFFGIASPSKLMKGYGENIGEGLAIGIQSSVGDVKRQVAQLNAAASDVRVGLDSTGAAMAGASSAGSINFDGLFAGATIIVRNDDDIRQLAREIWSMAQQAQRGLGGVRG